MHGRRNKRGKERCYCATPTELQWHAVRGRLTRLRDALSDGLNRVVVVVVVRSSGELAIAKQIKGTRRGIAGRACAVYVRPPVTRQ